MRRDDPPFADLVHVVATGEVPARARSEERVRAMADLAVRHRVTGSLASALREAGLDVPDPVPAAVAAARLNHLRAARVASRVAEAFEAGGIRWALVKGPALAARWPDPATAREYDDLDLLVEPSRMRDALAVLGALGFRERNRNWGGFRRLGVGEVPVDDGEVVVDLHWQLVGLQDHRRSVRVPTSELLGRTRTVDVAGVVVPTLSGPDTLVHACVHDAFAGAQSLVQLRDVHLVASSVPATAARDALRSAGVQRLASVVLARAEALFGPLGPQPLAVAMTGVPAWVALNRLVDSAWGARPGGWTPYPGSLVRAGRSTVPATIAVLAAELRSSIAVRTGRRTVISPGGPLDWDHDDGGPAERERYLDEVAAGSYGA